MSQKYYYCHMDDSAIKLFKTTLKSNNHSITKTRLIVFNLLLGQEPISMNSLMRIGNNRFDRASLYRTINLFEGTGIAHRVNFGWKYKIELTDKFAHHHHHLSCTNCGKIIPISEDHELEKIIMQIANSHNFSASKHQIEIQGLCGACTRLKDVN